MASVLIEVLVNHPQCRFQISAQVMQADPSRWHRFNSSVYSLLVRGEIGNLFTYEIICEAEQELFYVLHSFVDMKDRLILLSCVKWMYAELGTSRPSRSKHRLAGYAYVLD